MRRFVELVAFVAGWAAVIYGLAEIYQPLAWIAGGTVLVAAALVSRRKP